jgi:hypothetical protein
VASCAYGRSAAADEEGDASAAATATAAATWTTRLCLPTYSPAHLAATHPPAPTSAPTSDSPAGGGKGVDSPANEGYAAVKVAGLSSAGVLAAWRLFSLFDRDCDGVLAGTEAARMWASLSPLADGDGVWAEWAEELEGGAAGGGADGAAAALRRTSAVAGGLVARPLRPAALALRRAAHLTSLFAWFAAHFSCAHVAGKRDSAARAAASLLSAPPAPPRAARRGRAERAHCRRVAGGRGGRHRPRERRGAGVRALAQ